MKRISLAVVLFSATALVANAGLACEMHAADKKGEKHAKAEAGEKKAHGAACDHAKGEAGEQHAHKATCPMKDKKVAESKDVTMTGKLLCMKCNMQKEEKCRKVFQSSDNLEKLYNLCPGSDLDLEKIAEEGSATVTIKGKLVKAEDGTEMLKLESAEKVAAPAA